MRSVPRAAAALLILAILLAAPALAAHRHLGGADAPGGACVKCALFNAFTVAAGPPASAPALLLSGYVAPVVQHFAADPHCARESQPRAPPASSL